LIDCKHHPIVLAMGRFTSEPSVLSIIVTSECPVKNTFIHYPGECDRVGVKRFTTDPSSESRSLASLTRRSLAESLDLHSTQFRNEGIGDHCERKSDLESSVSDASQEDEWSAADTELSLPCDCDTEATKTVSTWSPTSTPESSPRCSCVSYTAWVPPVVWNPKPPVSILHFPSDAETVSPAPFQILEDYNFLFGFMMRRVTGIAWGVEVKRDVINEAWLVSDVTSDGAIEAWNNQVKDGPNADKAMRIGDLIVSVNGQQDWRGMMREMKGNEILNLKMLRIKGVDANALLNESKTDLAHCV